MATDQKRLQMNLDAEVAHAAETVIYALGLTPTTVINALYRRIAATGQVPFVLGLTEAEKEVVKQMAKLPAPWLETKGSGQDAHGNATR